MCCKAASIDVAWVSDNFEHGGDRDSSPWPLVDTRLIKHVLTPKATHTSRFSYSNAHAFPAVKDLAVLVVLRERVWGKGE